MENETAEAFAQASQLLVENPEISAATFLNLLKSKGVTLVFPTDASTETEGEMDPEPVEADSASSNAQALRPGVQESSFKFNAVRLLEANGARDNGIGFTKFRSVLIQEGLGNFKDRFFYTREALSSAIPVFEGKKIYADHPSAFEEQSRPERSVKDVLGYFENVALEEDDAGRAMLTADVQLLDDQQYAWARGLMRHAVEYSKKFPDKDFVGLSINASGDAEEVGLDSYLGSHDLPQSILPKIAEAKAEGIDAIRVVSRINNAVSCDLVTEAGAGGKVLQMIEQEKKIMKAKTKEAEESKHEEKEPKDKAPEDKKPAPKKDDAAAADKDNAKGDAEVIARLASKMGKDGGEDTSEHEALAKEALEMAKGRGLEGEEALKCAEYGMHMAVHMKKKKEAAEAAEAESKTPMEAVEATEAKDDECHEGDVKAYESLRAKYLALKGENAALKESLSKIDVENYLDEKCAKSGLPMSVTKGFKESLGAIKSVKDIDRAFDLFKKGYESRSESHTFEPLVLSTEKVVRESFGSNAGAALSFADCKR